MEKKRKKWKRKESYMDWTIDKGENDGKGKGMGGEWKL